MMLVLLNAHFSNTAIVYLFSFSIAHCKVIAFNLLCFIFNVSSFIAIVEREQYRKEVMNPCIKPTQKMKHSWKNHNH